jgi:hypothetical protein
MRSRLSRKARETACSRAFGVLASAGIPVAAFSAKISRFVILEGGMCCVNRPTVLLCLEVPLLALPTASAGVAVGKTDFTVKAVPSAEAAKASPLPAGARFGSLTDQEREAVRDLVQTMRKRFQNRVWIERAHDHFA